jgi:putative nucleotidyltransferase with HDIG domain
MSDLPAKLKRLNAAARELAGAENLEQLLERILDVVQAVFARPTAAVLLRDPAGSRLTVAASRGYEAEVVKRYHPLVGEGIAGSVAKSGRPRLCPDVTRELDYVPGVRAARSEMAVPLTVDGEVIGVLDVESQKDAFGEEDMALLEAFGEQAAWAIRHGRLLVQAQRRAKRLELLNRAARELTAAHDPDELLARILDLANQALGFHNVAVLVPDRERKRLVVRKALRPKPIDGLSFPVTQGLTGAVFLSGEPVLVPDVSVDPRYLPGGVEGPHAELVAPLKLNSDVIGVLDAEADPGQSFTQLDLEVFCAFAAQVATALRSAQLLWEVEDRANRLSLISRTSRALNTVLDADALLSQILESVADALGLEQAAILIFYPQQSELVVHAARGYGEEVVGKQIALGEGVTGGVALSGEAALVGDVEQESRYLPGVPGGRSEMAVPLRVYGELFGVLDAESQVSSAFGPRDLELFQIFADQAAVALHNARQFQRLEKANARLKRNMEEMERLNRELERYAGQIAEANKHLEHQIRQLTALHQAGQAITSSLDLRRTLEAILKMSGEIVTSSAGAIKLVDEESKELRVAAYAGALDEHKATTKYDLPLRIGERTIGVFEVVREASELGDSERRLLETLASQAAIAIENARLFESTQRIYYETLKSLAKALEARDDYTRGHSDRVADLALAIAGELALAEEECHLIYNSALLHDIGKIGVRDEVLLKPRKLTDEEMDVIRKHPTYGCAILGPLKFLGRVAELVGCHHERWDGSGYPAKLRGEEIPLPSRIISVADAYDAMTSSRPYRKALSHDDALDEIEREAGRQLDPTVVQAFLRVIEKRRPRAR